MSKKLSVGFDAHVLDGRFQGSRTVITRLATTLAGRHSDIDVNLYCAADPEIEGAATYRALRSESAIKRLLFDLPKLVRRDRLDALIYQYISVPWSRNSWVIVHDILPFTHARYFSVRFILRCAVLYGASMLAAKGIVVVSQYTLNEITKIAPFLREKIHVVRNGPSFDQSIYFKEKDISSSNKFIPIGKKYILAVGRIEKRKNIDLLTKAFKLARVDGVVLVIVGKCEPEYSIDLTDDNVIHLENVNEDILASLHANADLFVYPSAAEGFGLPLLDSVLFGTPTLSSSQTAMPEVGGALAEYFDPLRSDAVDVLSQRMAAHFLGKPVRTPSLDERRSHALTFSWERSADLLALALRGTP